MITKCYIFVVLYCCYDVDVCTFVYEVLPRFKQMYFD